MVYRVRFLFSHDVEGPRYECAVVCDLGTQLYGITVQQGRTRKCTYEFSKKGATGSSV